MPEGDTVWLAAKRMDQALAGRPVTRFELRTPRLALVDLTGATVLGVAPVGKHMLIRFEDPAEGALTLHSHFRMDGSWRLSRPGAPRGGGAAHQIRAIIDNADWQATGLRLHDLAVLPTADEASIVGHLGPDILAPEWADQGLEESVRRIEADPDRTIGEAILDQRTVAGIGNLYKVETLFVERVNPWTAARDVDVAALLATAHRLMRANRDHPEQSTTGRTGRGVDHWVYGRGGQPCLRCRTPISVAYQGDRAQERITFWCPTCQPGGPPDP
jgi:endonuclease-8